MQQHVQDQAPQPGTWLEVSDLDSVCEEEGLALGDKLYFRVITSLGLFECYAPKLGRRFWIDPENVQAVTDLASVHALEQEVPAIYRI